MKAYYKVYDMLKDQEKEVFSVELKPWEAYILARDPSSEDYQLILIRTLSGKEVERKELPLRKRGVSRYDLAIGKSGSLVLLVMEDARGLDIQMRSPPTTTYPVLAKYKNGIIGIPLGDEFSVREFTGIDRKLEGDMRFDLYIYYVSPYNYIGSIVISMSAQETSSKMRESFCR